MDKSYRTDNLTFGEETPEIRGIASLSWAIIWNNQGIQSKLDQIELTKDEALELKQEIAETIDRYRSRVK